MDFISSDTNIWIDFSRIGSLPLPFKLHYIYLMEANAFDKEILNPPDLKKRLQELGLKRVELTEKEEALADEYFNKFSSLSVHDCSALAIAKTRKIVLLTGDGALREIAQNEGVEVKGTIWVLDQLLKEEKISTETFRKCILCFLKNEGGQFRLPKKELVKRYKETFEVHCTLAYSQNSFFLRREIIPASRVM